MQLITGFQNYAVSGNPLTLSSRFEMKLSKRRERTITAGLVVFIYQVAWIFARYDFSKGHTPAYEDEYNAALSNDTDQILGDRESQWYGCH